jgi:DNA mismatch repair protein MutS2
MSAREEVEDAIREVRAADSEAVEEASRRARSRVEEAARQQARRPPPPRDLPQRRATRLDVGQRVRFGQSGALGRLAEIRDERGIVETAGVRFELALTELAPVEESSRRSGAPEPRRGSAYTGSFPDPSTEVDLRGLRVDEVEIELGRALDAAVLGDLAELRIIHGKGTGAVRARVVELLRLDSRVNAFRPGLTGEGGSGVTVARVGGE